MSGEECSVACAPCATSEFVCDMRETNAPIRRVAGDLRRCGTVGAAGWCGISRCVSIHRLRRHSTTGFTG